MHTKVTISNCCLALLCSCQTKQVEEVFKQGLNSSKCGVGRLGGRRGDTPIEVPDVELPDFFDDSNDLEVFYGFSEDECDTEIAEKGTSVERVHEYVLPLEVKHLFNSDSDDMEFEGFEEDERLINWYQHLSVSIHEGLHVYRWLLNGAHFAVPTHACGSASVLVYFVSIH